MRDAHEPRSGPKSEAVHGEDTLQIIAFRVGKELFGIDIHQVQEIIRDQRLTRVPNAPDFMEGVINLRGKIVPVIALRKRFGIVEEAERVPRIVVLAVHQKIVGFAVDSVPEVLRVEPDSVSSGPKIADGGYVSGVAKLNDRLVILIHADRVLQPEECVTGLAHAAV